MIPQTTPLYVTTTSNAYVSVVVGWDAGTRRPYVVPIGIERAPDAFLIRDHQMLRFHLSAEAAQDAVDAAWAERTRATMAAAR